MDLSHDSGRCRRYWDRAGLHFLSLFIPFQNDPRLVGCPAEEKGGGKIIMVQKGVFDSVDVAMMVHPENKNSGTQKTLTLVPLEITFEGKSSHASAAPE